MTIEASHTEASRSTAIERRALGFDGKRLSVVVIDGVPHCVAREVGRALGYEDDGKGLLRNLANEWAEEFVEGTHWRWLQGPALAAYYAAKLGGEENSPPKTEVKSSTSRRGGNRMPIVLLTEAGMNLVLLKTHKPEGKRLRATLAEEVMPQLNRTGQYTPAGALPAPSITEEQVKQVAASIAQETVAPVLARLDSMLHRLGSVEHLQTPGHTVFCGPSEAARLRGAMRGVAHVRTAYARPSVDDAGWTEKQKLWRRLQKRELGEIHRAVRDVVALDDKLAWEYLPIRDLTPAWETVHRLRAQAERDAEQRAKDYAQRVREGQGELPIGGPKKN